MNKEPWEKKLLPHPSLAKLKKPTKPQANLG